MPAYLLTLTSANTNYRISTLVAAINTKERTAFSQIIVQAHPGIDAAGANTNDILVGDGSLSTTRFAAVLGAGDMMDLGQGSAINSVSTHDFYVRSAGAAQKISIFLLNG